MAKLNLRGVLPVPPLARKFNSSRTLDIAANDRIVQHIVSGGITRLLYGGNAFLYHITLAEYAELLDWLSSLSADLTIIPSAGPSYGRAIDQAALLRRYSFPCVMMLPCADPRDAAGLEAGYREIASALGGPLVVYLKDENNFGNDKEAGLDAVARLVDSGICVAIKYAVVRQDPSRDAYLEALLERVPREVVISGIGERPAIAHMRDFQLQGFTTGSGCIAPRLSNDLHEACTQGDYAHAERIQAEFLPLEDLRDAWGPARVLHSATSLAEVAITGPIPPYVSALSEAQKQQLEPVSRSLLERNQQAAAAYA